MAGEPRILSDKRGEEKPNVAIEFYTTTEKDEAASREAGHAVFRDVDNARWYKLGSNGQATECRVERLPKFYPLIWHHFRARYDAWKAGQEPPLDGTPLTEWPAASRAEVETLRGLHIRTVEELAGVTDGDAPRIGMGAMRLRDKARAWLKTAEERGKITEALASRDATIATMQTQMQQQSEELAQMRATLDRLKPREKIALQRAAAE